MVFTHNRDLQNLEMHFGCAGSRKVLGRSWCQCALAVVPCEFRKRLLDEPSADFWSVESQSLRRGEIETRSLLDLYFSTSPFCSFHILALHCRRHFRFEISLFASPPCFSITSASASRLVESLPLGLGFWLHHSLATLPSTVVRDCGWLAFFQAARLACQGDSGLPWQGGGGGSAPCRVSPLSRKGPSLREQASAP